MEWYGYFGYIAFVFMMCFMWPDHEKVKKLERKIKVLEKKQKGEESMSKVISDLVNTDCKLSVYMEGALSTKVWYCTVLDADEEWVKIRYVDKNDKEIVKIIRIENIVEVNL